MGNYRLGLYEKSMPGELPISEKLQAAKRAGFDYMELSIDETDAKLARLDWSGEEIQAVRRAQDEEGIPISSICLSGHRKYPLGHPDPAVQARSLEIMEKAVVLAARLGVRLGVTPADMPERLEKILSALGLPTHIDCTAGDYAAAIGLDKKGTGADLSVILLEALGRAVPHKMPKAELLALLEELP